VARSLVNFVVPYDWFKEKKLASLRASQIQRDSKISGWLLRALVRSSDNTMIGHLNGHGYPGMEHLPFVKME